MTTSRRHLFPLALLWLAFAACEAPEQEQGELLHKESGNQLQLVGQPLAFGDLHLYPVQAAHAAIAAQGGMGQWRTLENGLNSPGFYITEKKPYGRADDASAVGNLTVQNKSQDTIFLMAGDVVQGGNQDRILAQSLVVPPRFIGDVAVFCVEKGRWSPRPAEGQAPPAGQGKARPDMAFSGYYQVGSPSLRRAALAEQSQEAVWADVARLTQAHAAEGNTGAYASLEQATAFSTEREAYVQHLTAALDGRDNVLGLVAVSGGRIIGADVFGHPALFAQKREALLRAYATEAITDGEAPSLSPDAVRAFAERALSPRQQAAKGFRWGGRFVHLAHVD